MAINLPNPPPASSPSDFNSPGWQNWFARLAYKIRESAQLLWTQIDFTGSNITSIVSRLFTDLQFTGSNLTSLVTRNHNDLQNIQGGAAGDYQHLTTAQVGIVNGAAPLDSPAFTGTPTAPTAPIGTNTTQIATTAFVQTAIGSTNGFIDQNFITGLIPSWVSATAIDISSGKCYISSLGEIYTVSASISLTGLALTASTMYYLYLYDNAGTPAVEVVTTLPALYGTTAANKTGDTSRRYLGSILTDTSSNIYRFRSVAVGNKLTQEYVAVNNVAPFRVLSGGTATTPTSFSISGVVPAVVSCGFLFGGTMVFPATGDADFGVGYDMLSVTSGELSAAWYARAFSEATTQRIFYFPPQEIPIAGTSLYYASSQNTGTTNAIYVDTRGFSVMR